MDHPETHHEKETSRCSAVSVPLYRTGDVEALLDLPDVNWHEVREIPKGSGRSCGATGNRMLAR